MIGGFVYGTLNRLLIPLGLHHILNSGPWFIIGDYTASDGTVVPRRHRRGSSHGDPTAGAFMTGFFPIMMFALPAAALAIYHEPRSRPTRRPIGGIMLSAALTSFLTGVTEPLEFAFMFVAWPLYVIHALLTGTSLALVNALGDQGRLRVLGRALRLRAELRASPPGRFWLVPIGLGYAAIYYFLFRAVIQQVEPAHAGTRGRRRSRVGHERLRVLISAARVVTPARSSRRGGCSSTASASPTSSRDRHRAPPDLHLPAATVVPGLRRRPRARRWRGSPSTRADPRRPPRVAAAHLRHGTTTLMASLVTDGPERAGPPGGASSPRSVDDGLLAGIHLEGPWLEPEARRAPTTPPSSRDPTPAAVDRLLAAGAGPVRMVTLAPELPGGMDAVRRLTAAGVVAAIGHTDATYDDARAALDAGASVGTHLFNAMRGLHHREPGPSTALLEHPDAFVELIADGVHLHPAVLRLVADREAAPHRPGHRRDGRGRGATTATTVLGTMAVHGPDGVARLADTGAIAGSTLTMAAAVRFAVSEAGLPIEDAVRAATATPGGDARARPRRRVAARLRRGPRRARRRPRGGAGAAAGSLGR